MTSMDWGWLSATDYTFATWLFKRMMAAIYLVAFLVACNQFPPLLGERGLLPAPSFLARRSFTQAPSLFHWHYSDIVLKTVTFLGVLISILLFFNFLDAQPLPVSLLSWLLLYFFYLSIHNVGQNFYSFGWETMLCEAGFFAAFLGPSWMEPSHIPRLILLWMLFRVELGAGLIKFRGDPCWRDLTALCYHYETQPMPNPLSWYFHHLPMLIHKGGALFSHLVQMVIPFFLFFPAPLCALAGGLIIFHQLLLIISGNYSWLNWLTIALGVLAFPNSLLSLPVPELAPIPLWYQGILLALAAAALFLSIQPALNLFSRNQRMNYCWNRWCLVGAYGAFGSVTKERYEIVIEGSREGTKWQEYEFKGKPTSLSKVPPQIAPYHLRLDWLLWFVPLSVHVSEGRVSPIAYETWLIRFLQKLFEGDRAILKLIRHNPFPENPPYFLRVRFYHYRFTTRNERKESGNWWKRHLVGDYLPPLSLQDVQDALKSF